MMEWFFGRPVLSRTGSAGRVRRRFAPSLTRPTVRNDAVHAIDGVVAVGNKPDRISQALQTRWMVGEPIRMFDGKGCNIRACRQKQIDAAIVRSKHHTGGF